MHTLVKDTLTQADKKAAIDALLSVNLTIKERKVLGYKYFDGYTLEEIAEIMHASRDSVCKWKMSAEKKCEIVYSKGRV